MGHGARTLLTRFLTGTTFSRATLKALSYRGDLKPRIRSANRHEAGRWVPTVA